MDCAYHLDSDEIKNLKDLLITRILGHIEKVVEDTVHENDITSDCKSDYSKIVCNTNLTTSRGFEIPLGRFVFDIETFEFEHVPEDGDIRNVWNRRKSSEYFNSKQAFNIIRHLGEQMSLDDYESGYIHNALSSIIGSQAIFQRRGARVFADPKDVNDCFSDLEVRKSYSHGTAFMKERASIHLLAQAISLISDEEKVSKKSVQQAYTFYQALLYTLYTNYPARTIPPLSDPSRLKITDPSILVFRDFSWVSIYYRQKNIEKILQRIIDTATCQFAFDKLKDDIYQQRMGNAVDEDRLEWLRGFLEEMLRIPFPINNPLQ